MKENSFDQLKKNVQEVIDLISNKEEKSANNKLREVSEYLDEMLDHSDDDADLIEISHYQVLINQLFQKLNPDN